MVIVRQRRLETGEVEESVGMDLRGDLDRGQSGPGAREALLVQSAHSQHLASLSAHGPTTVSANKLI